MKGVGKGVVVVVFAALVVAAGLSGCQKRAIASSVSPCFRVLPQARAALGNQGSFVDVARVEGSSLPKLRPFGAPRRVTTTLPGSPTSTVPVEQHNVCLVAYKGTFDNTRIPLLRDPSSTGQYAVVVVSTKTNKVRAVVRLGNLPKPLHSH